ncbi:MAG: cytochrome c [Tabrizicola sp.]|uniref:c-type cytochrome n=1 Tax=Tabrizicola sp. TaxID=2005166 RepID=UPI0027347059|nr:cytochrome c [Tabrizicola sp.]MDP3263210.1 cytochrome c [Tabrizicola sp.]MDP3646567.1 cytochrome c [Paracoccaceae bacterium]MDZ4069462.1 cytochrome c [Tabrizicola sp.]
MRILRWLVAVGVIGAGGLWVLARPAPLAASAVEGLSGDITRGEAVFWAAGCASCHMAEKAEGDAELVLKGGQRFASEFGTFLAPNISQDAEHGIGTWSALDLANAITRGVSPEGEHLYPALPYASYAKMQMQDVVDLYAFMQTLPADPTPSQPHEIGFPFSQRAAVGVWKLMFVNTDWALPGNLTPTADRGRYIAEALAHCGECHTPRNALGALDTARWLAGAPNPSGDGKIPNITPAKLTWSAADIVQYLTTGFTPEYDSVGGHMAHVVENMARLPESDRQAVAEYLKAVPAAE